MLIKVGDECGSDSKIGNNSVNGDFELLELPIGDAVIT